MHFAVLADIHGDLPALVNALEDAKRQGAEKFLVLGDIVGGARSADCVEMLRSIQAVAVLGNHDSWMLDPESLMVRKSGYHLPEEAMIWLRELPLVVRIDAVAGVHASFHRPDRWPDVRDAATARSSFLHQPTEVGFFGHTHEAGFWAEGASNFRPPPTTLELILTPGRRYLINPGAVGRVSVGKTGTNYVIYDEETKSVRWRSVGAA